MSVIYYAVKGSSDPTTYYASSGYTSDGMAIVDPDTLEIKNGKAGNKKYVLFEEFIGNLVLLVNYSDLERLLESSLYMGQLTEPIVPNSPARLDNVYSVTLERKEKKDISVKYQGSLHNVKEVYVKFQGSLHRVKAIYKKEGGELKGREV